MQRFDLNPEPWPPEPWPPEQFYERARLTKTSKSHSLTVMRRDSTNLAISATAGNPIKHRRLLEFFTKEISKVCDVLSTETFVSYKNFNLRIPYILQQGGNHA
jgi:hypothetical protein